MPKVRIEIEVEEDVLERATAAAQQAGRSRDEFLEDALRRQLASGALAGVLERVRARSGELTGDEALELAYAERDALRAERRAAAAEGEPFPPSP